MRVARSLFLLLLLQFFDATASAQIDPDHRELIQVGYNAAFEGHQPISAYLFYYANQPGFLQHTNLTLRMAVAPTYLDSELGISGALGENTGVGLGLAGGGFADSYVEIDQGTYIPSQSFFGHGGEVRAAIYHLFNPGQRIPLNGVLRATAHYSVYADASDTAEDFELPTNRPPPTYRPARPGAAASLSFSPAWRWNFPFGTRVNGDRRTTTMAMITTAELSLTPICFGLKAPSS